MEDIFSRFKMLVGNDGFYKISGSSIIIFGVGGVGSHAAESFARCGISRIDLCDGDVVSPSNINRQILALQSTVGIPKTTVMKNRILDINPDCSVNEFKFFYSSDTYFDFDLSKYDYIIDAIDSVESKMLLIKSANELHVPIISALGAGNKLDPTKFEVSDIYKTSVCPLAKVIRKKCKEANIEKLKVVYSKEQPVNADSSFISDGGKRTVGSASFCVPVMGYIMASEVIKDIINK